MNRHQVRRIAGTGVGLCSLIVSCVAFAQAAAPATSGAPELNPAPVDDVGAPASALAPVPPEIQQSAPAPAAPPTSPPPPPKIYLAGQAPAPPPVTARTDKTHDGFYARLNFGFASQGTTIDDGFSAPNFHKRSGALAIDALVGGAPAPGVILGGAFSFDRLPSTTFEAEGFPAKTGTTLMTIGPFIDGYPNPRGGFHLGGTVGPCIARLTNNTDFVGTKANGFGLAAWLGYDWWVADQWSVGGLLRFSGANTSNPSGSPTLSVDTRSIALMFTAVYQ